MVRSHIVFDLCVCKPISHARHSNVTVNNAVYYETYTDSAMISKETKHLIEFYYIQAYPGLSHQSTHIKTPLPHHALRCSV